MTDNQYRRSRPIRIARSVIDYSMYYMDEPTQLDRQTKRRQSSKSTSRKTHQCEYCNYSSNRLHHMISHQGCHTGDKPHRCRRCSFKTSWKSSLKNHLKTCKGVKRVIDGGPAHKCDRCTFVTTWPAALANHLKSCNPKSNCSLPKRVRRPTKNSGKLYNCPHCSFSSAWQQSLYKHLRENKRCLALRESTDVTVDAIDSVSTDSHLDTDDETGDSDYEYHITELDVDTSDQTFCKSPDVDEMDVVDHSNENKCIESADTSATLKDTSSVLGKRKRCSEAMVDNTSVINNKYHIAGEVRDDQPMEDDDDELTEEEEIDLTVKPMQIKSVHDRQTPMEPMNDVNCAEIKYRCGPCGYMASGFLDLSAHKLFHGIL